MAPPARASLSQTPLPGGWTIRQIAIGRHRFELLVPADPDELLKHLVEPLDRTPSHLADPYWAKLWPAAELLASALLQTDFVERLSPVADRTCLELGCGSGLAGIAAQAAGLEVTFSDYVPQAVELALENAARNGFPQARGLVLDWRRPPSLQFPLILAADVTYDRANLAPLLGTLDAMLAAGGWAWFADAGRGPAAEFLSQARERGWSVTLLDDQGAPLTAPTLGRCQQFVLRRASDPGRD
jgi:predicted nicotinamide N-methyase